MMTDVQIYHLTNTDTEQVVWALDSDSKSVCIRTPVIFSVVIEARSVADPIKARIDDASSKNVPLTADHFRRFLSDHGTSFKALSISRVEATRLADIYFYQGGHTNHYLIVSFSNLQGFQRLRNMFQGKLVIEEEESEEEVLDPTDEMAAPADAELINIAATAPMHHNVFLIAEGAYVRFRMLESDIPPYWQWLIHHKLRACSTITIPRDAALCEDDSIRISRADYEYINVNSLSESTRGEMSTRPLILSWDIESLAMIKGKFPNAMALSDIAFFVSAYIKRYGDDNAHARRVGIYVVDSLETLGLTEPRLSDGTELIIVPDEPSLLDAFWKLIHDVRPHAILGYNTMGFDSRYLNHRMMIYQKIMPNISLMRNEMVGNTTPVRQFMWSSSACQNLEGWYYDAPGLIVLDLYIELKRGENLKSHTLNAVSEYFLKEHKVDLPAMEMFRIYKEYLAGVRTAESKAEMRLIAEYGIQDAVLPARIFDLRTQWMTYIQMASIMGIGIMDLTTRGQTLRTKSNIYRTCKEMSPVKFVINVPRDKPVFNGKYRGAYVCSMTEGLHDLVIVFDFTSLYPSIISAYNLCYSTFIHQRDWGMFPQGVYTSHMLTIGDTKREVRYVNGSVFKGILPRVVEHFLASRAAARKELKTTTDHEKKVILDKKQLAIKVSNNSVYGAAGADFVSKTRNSDVCTSSLGLKWIAMTVTEIGQILIKSCTSFLIKNYGAQPIYGDTDSTFFKLPVSSFMPTADGEPSLWDRAESIAAEFNKTLPPPLKIELEKIIRMIGLTAKRYLYRSYNERGIIKETITFKGVVATRRDTCKWQVELFAAVSEGILRDAGRDEVTKIIYQAIIDLMTGKVPINKLLIGSSVAETYASAGCKMAVLKARMAGLGRPIVGGSRIEYVVTQLEASPSTGPLDKILIGSQQQQKPREYISPYILGPRGGIREEKVSFRIRMLDEVVPGITKIDYAYYVAHMAMKSIDQLFSAAYQGDKVIEPLISGLKLKPERTVAEMEILMKSCSDL